MTKCNSGFSASSPLDNDLSSLLDPVRVSSKGDLELRLSAFDGDLRHKVDLRSMGFQPSDSDYQLLVMNSSQSVYLQKFHPDLVPKSGNGTPISDHSIATVFEHHYFTDIVFRSKYILRVTSGFR